MRFRDLILRNFWLKLFSVVLATLIWLAVSYNTGLDPSGRQRGPLRSREFADLPLLLLGEPASHGPLRMDPPRVSVKIRGPAETLESLDADAIRVFVQWDAGRSATGAYLVEAIAPPGLSVQQVTPNAVLLKPGEKP